MSNVGRRAQELAHALAALSRAEFKTEGKDTTRYWQRKVEIARQRFREACRESGRVVYEVGFTPELPWFDED